MSSKQSLEFPESPHDNLEQLEVINLSPPGIFLDTAVKSLTILATYTCTAACTECCFGCTPQVKGRLSLETIKAAISNAKEEFPGLTHVVFSGGECFLLKDDLYTAIAHAASLGLGTRCVTNGYWGKTQEIATETVEKLIVAGINEINISTGHDHQQWVPLESVVTAATTLVRNGILTVIMIEQNGNDDAYVKAFLQHPKIRDLPTQWRQKLLVRPSIWMPFTHDNQVEAATQVKALTSGCEHVFRNVVLTPHGQVAACCGLTMEHIPEMKLGEFDNSNLRALFQKQLGDFLKIWIHIEGPFEIVKTLLGAERADVLLRSVNHICHACALLHLDDEIRDALLEQWPLHVKRVLAQFTLGNAIKTVTV